MEHINRSFSAAWVQTHQFLGLPLPFIDHTTLNQKLEIQATATPGPTENVSLNFYVWGNKGHDFTKGADGFPKTLIIPHRATDGNLYGILPFVLRELNNDLSAAQRDLYILRKQVPVKGRNYWAYYGRRLDKSKMAVTKTYMTVNPETGEETPSEFIPNATNMAPTRPTMNEEGSWQTSGDYISVKAEVGLDITQDQINEMRNVARIIHGSEDYATMSEIGMCTGVTRVVNVPGTNGGSFNFTEGIGVQIASFVNVMYDLRFANSGLDVSVDMGVSEPIYRLTEADTNSAISP